MILKFSVLISVYCKENPTFFNRAMLSIWDDQIVKPNEIVLVKDGSLSADLNKCIQYWETKLCDILVVVSLPDNVGLGAALNIGLKECFYMII